MERSPYVRRHVGILEKALGEAINDAFQTQPDDPSSFVALHLLGTRPTLMLPVAVAPPVDGDIWTAVGWLASQDVAIAVAEAILHQHSAATELEAMKALGSGSAEALMACVVSGGLVQRLVARLHPKLVALAAGKETDPGRGLHGKFLQEGDAFTFTYGDMASFYGGLEAKIGAPDNKILEAMRREHTAAEDSLNHFTTSNYEVTTTPSTEWAFVVEPNQQGVTWPVELRLVHADHARVSLPLRSFSPDDDTLEKRLGSINGRLAKLGQSSMLVEEAIGGLPPYTGSYHRIPGSYHRIPGSYHRIPGPITVYLDPITVYLDPTTVYLDPVTVYLDPITVYLDPITVYLDPTTVYLDPTTVYLDPITVYLDPTTVYLDRRPTLYGAPLC